LRRCWLPTNLSEPSVEVLTTEATFEEFLWPNRSHVTQVSCSGPRGQPFRSSRTFSKLMNPISFEHRRAASTVGKPGFPDKRSLFQTRTRTKHRTRGCQDHNS